MAKNVVLITGASSGIGLAIAKVLARHKENYLIMAGRDREKLLRAAEEIKQDSPASIESIVIDVTDEVALRHSVEKLIEKHVTINTLIMSAGVSIHGYFGDLMTRDFDEVVTTNLRGRFLTAKAVWPSMTGHGGQIINISSASGVSSYPTGSIYSATSAAVNSLMDSMALEGQELGIKVSNIVLGQVDTPIWNPNDEMVNAARKGMLSADEVAECVERVLYSPENVHTRSITLHPFIMQPLLRGRNRGPGGKFPESGSTNIPSGDANKQNFRI